MQAFALPDIEVLYTAPYAAAAQAAAFGMAARVVCDRFKPADGGVYRNSESAPLFSVARVADPNEDMDVPSNPHGLWRLTPPSHGPNPGEEA